MKILLTKELGRLAKWLRILGLDAQYSKESKPASVIIQALRDDRFILTRNHRLPESRGIRIITLEKETIREQLKEALDKLGFCPKARDMFSRCTICNLELQETDKSLVKNKVPEYVFQTQERFYICPKCNRVYWHGTHWGNVNSIIKDLKMDLKKLAN